MEEGAIRTYGGGIGIISGAYAVFLSLAGMGMAMPTAPAMLGLGVAVLVHGALLLSPAWRRVRGVSGPLMVVWGAAMVALQIANFVVFQNLFMVDPGMVAVGSIMVLSGAVMWRYGMSGASRM